jgi:hypothetical protein
MANHLTHILLMLRLSKIRLVILNLLYGIYNTTLVTFYFQELLTCNNHFLKVTNLLTHIISECAGATTECAGETNNILILMSEIKCSGKKSVSLKGRMSDTWVLSHGGGHMNLSRFIQTLLCILPTNSQFKKVYISLFGFLAQ